MDDWKEKLNKSKNYLRYAQCLAWEGEWFFSGLSACKAFELLLPDNTEMGLSEYEYAKLAYNERIKFAIPKLWDRREEKRKAETIFFPDNYHERPSRIRNKIIHSYYKADEKYKNDTAKLIRLLFELPRMMDFEGELDKKNYETKRNLELALGVREFRESPESYSSSTINKEYFENLILARQEFFPIFREKLKAILNSSGLNKFMDLDRIRVSSTDSTSAYIWLTIPPQNLSKSIPEEYSYRLQLYMPTFSIVFTPLEVWTYLELAGMSYCYRVKYYDFVLKGKFESFLKKIQAHDNKFSGENGAILRDTKWYVFQSHHEHISNLLSNKEIRQYKTRVKGILSERYDNFRKRLLDDKAPVTWNIALPGWRDECEQVIGQRVEDYCGQIAARFITLSDLMLNLCSEKCVLPPFSTEFLENILKEYKLLIE